jgi:four helix bundle protein
MGTFTRFEDIEAWPVARQLTKEVYTLTRSGHFINDFSLQNQIQRASVSIMSNIAEGHGRKSKGDFGRFLNIAHASADEVQSLLYVALDIGYMDKPTFTGILNLTRRISAMINALAKYLKSC